MFHQNKTEGWVIYFFLLFIAGLTFPACITVKEIPMSPELRANNRSDRIDMRILTDESSRFFDYRVFKDSHWARQSTDSVTNPGLIFPRTVETKTGMSNRTVFGNDSTKCELEYASIETWETESRSIAGAVIDIFRKNPDKNKPESSQTWQTTSIQGRIFLTGFTDSIKFNCRKLGSSYFSGQLIAGIDTFFLESLGLGKGYDSLRYAPFFQLRKGSMMYALFQYEGGGFPKRNRVFLYTLAKPYEQLLIAAFLGVIVS